jgi:YVTN family beta-propeller protein
MKNILRMKDKEETKHCDGPWTPSTGVRILGMVCLMLIGGFGSAAATASYLGPVAVVASKDGKRLFVANADARQVAVVDVVSGKVTRSIAMPAAPAGMVLSPDGAKLYVTCATAKSSLKAECAIGLAFAK